MADAETHSQDAPKRNWGMIVAGTVASIGTFCLAIFNNTANLANDLIVNRKSASILQNDTLIKARDRLLNAHQPGWFGKHSMYSKVNREMARIVKEEKFGWLESFKQQSYISKASSIMFVVLGVLLAASTIAAYRIGARPKGVQVPGPDSASLPHQPGITQQEIAELRAREAQAPSHGQRQAERSAEVEAAPAL